MATPILVNGNALDKHMNTVLRGSFGVAADLAGPQILVRSQFHIAGELFKVMQDHTYNHDALFY